MEALKGEFSHGVGRGANDKSNEPLQHPFTTTKGQQEQKFRKGLVNSSMLQVLKNETLFKTMSKFASLA